MKKVKIIGIGGAGLNTLRHLVKGGIVRRADCIAVDWDASDLRKAKAASKIQIRCNRNTLPKATLFQWRLAGADKVYIVAGMGGDTGRDLAPLVARAAQDEGIYTMAYVYAPFVFEGKERFGKARHSIAKVKKLVDRMVVFNMENLGKMCGGKTTAPEAFLKAEAKLMRILRSSRN